MIVMIIKKVYCGDNKFGDDKDSLDCGDEKDSDNKDIQ